MSWVDIWVHVVFGTKFRQGFITDVIREEVFEHIYEYSVRNGIYIDRINGYTDHVHILISLSREHSISSNLKLIKGESSAWINRNIPLEEKFAWQGDYYAASVSKSHVPAVRNYIDRQPIHHKKKSFEEELQLLVKKSGMERIKA